MPCVIDFSRVQSEPLWGQMDQNSVSPFVKWDCNKSSCYSLGSVPTSTVEKPGAQAQCGDGKKARHPRAILHPTRWAPRRESHPGKCEGVPIDRHPRWQTRECAHRQASARTQEQGWSQQPDSVSENQTQLHPLEQRPPGTRPRAHGRALCVHLWHVRAAPRPREAQGTLQSLEEHTQAALSCV